MGYIDKKKNTTYWFKRLSFGLKNANTTCARGLGYLIPNLVRTYTYLDEILSELRNYNMKLNSEKCTFRVQSGKFIGFTIRKRLITGGKKPSLRNTIHSRQFFGNKVV